ncbi:MFS transporter [Aneurinibacillus sp. Ricciae_BoGa-3]|uniref:MFS transporter n=1 Tax=Aneurinibacillus sp. Ricciae_BoGa-3 TaxID=3022697 RepID=UPI002340D240|nr:MFS transporter [Aneurinibacillus sp. Ricciae_BoGa-3]WCK55700.1 MFS transporter [Aneurinibacillus sp. Ricciae_BoGa-3]
MPGKEPLWTKEFIFLSLSNLFLFFGFQMLLPTLPVFVAEHSGSNTEVGLVVGILTLAAVVVRPFVGIRLDSMGKKRILVIGNLIIFAAMGSYFWTATVLTLLMIRFLHGLGWGIATPAYGAIASDIIPASRRGEGMGYFGLGTTLAMALGPFFGIWLAKSYSYEWLFAACLLSTLVSMVLAQFVSVPDSACVSNEPAKVPAKFVARLVERQALFPSCLVFLLGVTYGGIVSFITLFGKEAGIANVGWFFLVNALSVFIIRPISGKIFDKKGHFSVLFPAAFASIIGLVLLSYASSTVLLILAAIFYGIGFGSIQPSLQAWTVNRTEPNRRGAANATFYNAFDLGIGGGGMLLGAVAGITSYAQMYRYSILILVIYLVVYLLYTLKRRERQKVKNA